MNEELNNIFSARCTYDNPKTKRREWYRGGSLIQWAPMRLSESECTANTKPFKSGMLIGDINALPIKIRKELELNQY